MKIKFDENLPESLLSALAACGHDVDNVRLEEIAGKDDQTVWNTAQDAGRFFITQDLDFSDIRKFEPGTHHGLLVVRLREPGRRNLLVRISEVFRLEDIQSWHGCFILLTDHKLRIQRPKQ